VTTRSM